MTRTTTWAMPVRQLVIWTVVLLAGMSASVLVAGDAVDKERILRTRMSTKTLYPVPTTAELKLSAEQVFQQTCKPIQLNYVIRHGTR